MVKLRCSKIIFKKLKTVLAEVDQDIDQEGLTLYDQKTLSYYTDKRN